MNELIKYGIDTLSYLIPRNARLTTMEFASLIRQHIDDPRAAEVAAEFVKTSGMLDRHWNGTQFKAENNDNRKEIAVRNAGLHVIRHPDHLQHDRGFYQVAPMEGREGKTIDGPFPTKEKAWDAAYETLGISKTANTEPEYDARTNAVFEEMRKIIERPNPLLQHYKNDFYHHDRNHLQQTAATGQYVWIVLSSSTHLHQLRVHPRNNESIKAALDERDSMGREVYLIDADRLTIKAISDATVRDMMQLMDYEVKGDAVWKENEKVADFVIDRGRWSAGKEPKATVSYYPVPGYVPSLKDLVALRQIGICEVINLTQSFFSKVGAVEWGADKVAIHDLIDKARAERAEQDSKQALAVESFERSVKKEVAETFAFYGTITADSKDRNILEGTGVVLGKERAIDDEKVEYTAKASPEAMKELDPYWGTFYWELSPLHESIKPAASIDPAIPVNSMSEDQLKAYTAYLKFSVDELQTPVGVQTYGADVMSRGHILKNQLTAIELTEAARKARRLETRAELSSSQTLDV